jgi:hypothetical protein
MRPILSLPALLACLCFASGAAVAEPSRVVCTLDRPVVSPDQTDDAAVFTDEPSGPSLQYQWAATGGAFTGSESAHQPRGAKASWSSEGLKPGVYWLTVRVTNAGRILGVCTVQALVVDEAARSGGPATTSSAVGRYFLTPSGHEGSDYGFYSYILLARRPDGDNEALFKKILHEYLRLNEPVRLETYLPTKTLNATYVPVDNFREDPDEKWLFDHYDYARAEALLARLNILQEGPFLISALHPITAPGGPGDIIKANLATTPVSVVPFWMTAFYGVTTQQREWNKRSVGTFLLDLRTVLARGAEGLPIALEAVKAAATTIKTP